MNNSISDNENNGDTNFSTSNEKEYAVALGYDKDKDNAPIVLAKGAGDIAQKIIKIAEENNIEIRQDADLLQILKAVDINEEIPVEAFAAVAEIISYIYKKNAQS
jgi:flagellar biosynthesis protein